MTESTALPTLRGLWFTLLFLDLRVKIYTRTWAYTLSASDIFLDFRRDKMNVQRAIQVAVVDGSRYRGRDFRQPPFYL